MGNFAQESIGEAQVVEDFERRWMDGVASKITEEIRVFFEDDHLQPGSREKKSKHGASRAAARYATAGGQHQTMSVIDPGSRGITSAQIRYSSNAIGPVTSAASAQTSRMSVGSTSK
jgi:hypothetical protein